MESQTQTLKKSKFKPCPICHSERIKTQYRKPYSIIKCKECGYRVSVADWYEEADGKAEAIEVWNRRAEE